MLLPVIQTFFFSVPRFSIRRNKNPQKLNVIFLDQNRRNFTPQKLPCIRYSFLQICQKPVLNLMMILLDYGSLWTKHFEVMELNKIMRQKDDLKFVATLNNIRTNTQTDEDIALIQTRIIQKDSKLPTFSFTYICNEQTC